MNTAAARTNAPPPVVFRDAFGERRRIAAPSGSEALDVLCLRHELTAVPSFEFALRERVSRLGAFRHPYFAQVRTVERLNDTGRTLTLISNARPGDRLSDVLTTAAKHDLVLDIDSALCLIRQLVTAMATFHEQAPDVAHGALGPERIVITENARLAIVEHVLGAAVEQLQFSEDRYWRDLRVPCPRSAGLPAMDQRTDVLQIGMVALTLILRRLLQVDEFPSHVGDAVVAARAMSANGDVQPLPSGLRPWLTSALQLDPRAVFSSAIEAREELERVFERNDDIGAPASLEAFLARYHECTDQAGAHQATPSAESQPASEAPADAVIPITPEPVLPESFGMLTPREPIIPAPPFHAEPAPTPLASTPRPTSFSASPHLAPGIDPTSLFDRESKAPMVIRSLRKRGSNRMAVAAVLLLSVIGGGTLAARRFFATAPVSTGTVTVTTNPPGAEVFLDGQPHGVSPTMLTVSAGTHVLELRGAGEPRTMSLDVAAGAQLSQYIEMAKGQVTVGSLHVRTEPSGARISVDGVARGSSPVTVSDLTPGEHSVVVETEAGTTRQTVVVEAGATASLVAQMPAAAANNPASGGWISVAAPRTVQLFEEGRLLGSSDSERLMLPAGTHRIDIVNETLGFRSNRIIQITAGKVSPISVEFPKGTIALNAVPWADVWIDGEKVGETPIGNLSVAIGSHEIIFRHPELGEQRHVATVTLAGPARVSVDMRKKP
jgi:hypothetical protein